MRDFVYAYIDGNDLEPIADVVRARCKSLMATRQWVAELEIVDDRDGDDWSLGLNIEAPRRRLPAGFEEDIAALAEFLKNLAAETGREIAAGFAAEAKCAEDWVHISAEWHDYNEFRELFVPLTEPPEFAQYLYRTVAFDFEDGRAVAVVGIRRTAFDDVGEFLLRAADGTRTVAQLLAELEANPPPRLRGDPLPAVSDTLRTLRGAGFVALADTPQILPHELAVPVSER